MLSIDDEESLKKENITIESYSKELSDLNQKIINLKNSIEKEITQIDNIYSKVNDEIKKSYELKHEKLIIEENNLREELQNEVTKTKEKLEIFLSTSNELIKTNERINKGIKSYEKDEKNNIKLLSYVSKINKNKKEIKVLLTELMKSIKISFEKEQSNLKFEDYCFNGIPVPKDIEFKNIKDNSFEVLWKIDDINFINIDNKKFKYIIEIRKDNEKDNFTQIYEGNNTKFFVENLSDCTDYEIKICCSYNDLKGSWSTIKKVKTSHKNYSIILEQSQKKNEFTKKLLDWTGYKSMELIYRATRDGSTSKDFHKKCDNQGPTISLFKDERGNIFGGYASISWSGQGLQKSAPDSFIFTLSNIYNTEPIKFQNSDPNNCVYHNIHYGPWFGYGDIGVQQEILKVPIVCDFPSRYKDSLGKGKSIFTGHPNNNEYNLIELEVFKLSN